MKTPFDSSTTNVHGWERSASLGGGLALLGTGLHRGGLLGLAAVALGGLLLARGVSGRCAAKRLMQKKAQPRLRDNAREAKARYAHMPLDSEVHSPDFTMQEALPDTTPMGHETHVATPRS